VVQQIYDNGLQFRTPEAITAAGTFASHYLRAMAVWAIYGVLSSFNGTKIVRSEQECKKGVFSRPPTAWHYSQHYHPSGFHESDLVSPARFLDDRRARCLHRFTEERVVLSSLR